MSRSNALPAAIGGSTMKFMFALIAASAFAMSPAMAQDSGFYVGAGIGDFGVEVDGFSDSDTAFKVFGGYKFAKYFAADLEYLDGGTVEDGGLEIDVSGFNLSGVGILPVGEKFNLFAKLGMILWDAETNGFGDDSGEDFSWGIGAGYSFTDQFGMQLEYQGFEIEDTDTVDLISVSASWTF
jgi:opacity protein-like surface antigen